MTESTWKQIYELVGRVQQRALGRQDWEVAKDVDRITALLRNLPEEISSNSPCVGRER